MRQPRQSVIDTRLKPAAHLLALLPFVSLLYAFAMNALGANPVEAMTHSTGEWGLRFLLLTLCVSPLARVGRARWLMQFRRPLGLYCAFYVSLHFLVYLVFDQSLSLRYLAEDIRERPYITVGFMAFVLLIPLVATSSLAARRRMGRKWNRLHKLVYAVGALAIVHLLWLTKADFNDTWVYGILYTILMVYRLPIRSLQRMMASHLSRDKTVS